MDPQTASLLDLESLELDESEEANQKVRDDDDQEEDEDGLLNKKNTANNAVIMNGGSPRKKPAAPDGEALLDENEDAGKNNRSGGGGGSCQPSPCHSWISNASSCTNLFGEDDDEEGEGDGGEDDYEYDPYTHEYVPRLKEPPEGEDSDDGLLISRQQRDASLSFVAQALLESARANRDKWEKEKEAKLRRRSSAERISCLAKMLFCSGKALCHIDDMPKHLQFNKYILSGYRKLGDFSSCVWSLSYLHNETLNILTHVAPIIYILLYWGTMFPWSKIEGNTFLNILGWAHISASISPWIGSVIYHLFMSYHEGGERFYQILLQIDMFGIWVTECFGAISNLTAACWCLPKDYQTAMMTCYGLAAVYGLQKALTAWTPLSRRMCFAPVFVSRILAFGLRISPWGGGNPAILHDVILQDVLSILGGVIGVVRIPEKWFPGRLDLWLNSHHIMHLMVVWAVVHMNSATNGDINWVIGNYNQAQCPVPGLLVSS